MTIKLGVVTDEVSPDLEEALEWARERQLDYVDLRDIEGENICEMPEEKVARVEEIIARYGLPVMTICPQLFRAMLNPEEVRQAPEDIASIPDAEASEYVRHLKLLRKALELAEQFNAPYIRTFAFWRLDETEETFPALVEAMRQAAAMARQAGRVLLLENEAVTFATSGGEAARLIEAVGDSGLAAIWDPGNAFYHPEEIPYPDGYLLLRPYIRVIHAKDATEAGFAVLGKGEVDWAGQLAALRRDGYDGCISVEPRAPLPGGTVKDASEAILAYLRQAL